MRWILCGLLIAAAVGRVSAQEARTFDAAAVGRFAQLALDCVHQDYPNKISHVLGSDADVRPPRELTPVFCGCFDWHSAVHGHWLLVRLCRVYPESPQVGAARAALAESFTDEKVAAEVAYFQAKEHKSFERPYGLAWLLQLSAELHEWDDPQARRWAATLEPLEQIAAARFRAWLPKLSYPVRTGEHSQTAFAMGLVYDWARSRGDEEMLRLVTERAREYYLKDRGANLAFEPDGQAFLSPILAEADLMRRIMEAGRVRRLARRVPAGAERWLPGRLAAAGGRNGQGGRPPGAPRRPEPLAGVDAGGDRRRAAAERRPCSGPVGRHRRAQESRSGSGQRRALRGRALAGQLRRVPRHPARPIGIGAQTHNTNGAMGSRRLPVPFANARTTAKLRLTVPPGLCRPESLHFPPRLEYAARGRPVTGSVPATGERLYHGRLRNLRPCTFCPPSTCWKENACGLSRAATTA